MAGRIIEDNRKTTGWVKAIFDGYRLDAKVYDEGSEFGINEGRVSKLCIFNKDKSRQGERYCFNYDRGLDFDRAPAGLVERIVDWLEGLPPVYPEE